MRIACPDCAAEYDVPAERMAPGRAVRCAKCGVKWSPVPALPPAPPEPTPAAPPPPDPVAAPPPAAYEPLQEVAPATPAADPGHAEEKPAPMRRLEGVLLVAAWLASLAILGGAGYAAVKYRTAVIQAWPPSARVYTWVGLAHQPTPR